MERTVPCVSSHSPEFLKRDRYSLIVPTQPIDTGLLLRRFGLDEYIRHPARRLVGCRAGTPIRGLLLSAKSTTASEEDGHLVVEDLLLCLGVDSGHAMSGYSRIALVNNLDEFSVRQKATRCRDRVLANLKILLAMKKHHGAEVGHQVIVAKGSLGVKGRDDAVCGQDLEVFGPLKHVTELSPLRTNAKVVKHYVAFGEIEFGALGLGFQTSLYGFQMLVATGRRITLEHCQNLCKIVFKNYAIQSNTFP